jgi:hypothetical protein
VTTTPFSAHPKTPASTMSTPPNTLIKQDNHNSYNPPGPSRLTSARGTLHHRSSKESIQSYETSLSNFSTHTTPSGIYKDREDLSGQDRRPHTSRHYASNPFRSRNFSVSEFNYSDTLQKSIFSLQNESQSGTEPARRSSCASAFLPILTFLSHITISIRSSDVYDIHTVHSALEMGANPPSRSYSHSIRAWTNDNVDEPCELRWMLSYHWQFTPISSHFQ